MVENEQGVFYYYDYPASYGGFWIDNMISPVTGQFADTILNHCVDSYWAHSDLLLETDINKWEQDDEDEDGRTFTTKDKTIGGILTGMGGYSPALANYFTGATLVMADDEASSATVTGGFTYYGTAYTYEFTIGNFGTTTATNIEAYLANPTPKAAPTAWSEYEKELLATYGGEGLSFPFYSGFTAGLSVWDFSEKNQLILVYDMLAEESSVAAYAGLLEEAGWTLYAGGDEDEYWTYAITKPSDETKNVLCQLAWDVDTGHPDGAFQMIVYSMAKPVGGEGLEACNAYLTAITADEITLPAITDEKELGSNWELSDLTAMANDLYGDTYFLAYADIDAEVATEDDAKELLQGYYQSLLAAGLTVADEEEAPAEIYDGISLVSENETIEIELNYLNGDDGEFDGTINIFLMVWAF